MKQLNAVIVEADKARTLSHRAHLTVLFSIYCACTHDMFIVLCHGAIYIIFSLIWSMADCICACCALIIFSLPFAYRLASVARSGCGSGARRRRWPGSATCWARSWCAATMSLRCCTTRRACSSPRWPRYGPTPGSCTGANDPAHMS